MLRFIKEIIKGILYRPRGVNMGRKSYVLRPRWIYNPKRISIGNASRIGRFAVLNPVTLDCGHPLPARIDIADDVYIGGYAQIHAMDRVSIGEGCVLSEYVYISDISHGLDPDGGPIMAQPLESKGPVTIGARTFIGLGSSVLPGVTLGQHCVVGTNSVVTRSFPDYSMVSGSPATLVKKFDLSIKKWIPVK